jgi:pimeloyl-[acyl-carrier protein] methyl ester esterase
MYVAEAGQGRPLIFLHGWSSHGGYFAPQVEAFRESHHVLVPDLPGHRRSIAPLTELSIPHLADRLHEAITARGLQHVILVGWSMGAMVAFDYIARHGSAALDGLVIEDMTAKIVNDFEWRLGIRNGFDAAQNAAVLQAMQADWAGYATGSLPRLFARTQRPDQKLYDWIGGEIVNNDGRAMAALWASLAEQDHRTLLPRLRLPVLLLHGSDSQLYDPAVAEWMEAQIPGARRICLERTGHTPHLENPAAYNAALKTFLAAL